MMPGYYGGGWNWVAFVIMMVFMALIPAGIVVAIVFAIRGIAGDGRTPYRGGPDEDRALALLRERYARGEIDHEEYEERRRRLASDASPRS